MNYWELFGIEDPEFAARLTSESDQMTQYVKDAIDEAVKNVVSLRKTDEEPPAALLALDLLQEVLAGADPAQSITEVMFNLAMMVVVSVYRIADIQDPMEMPEL